MLCLYYVMWDIFVFFRVQTNPQSPVRVNLILFRCRDLLIKELEKINLKVFGGGVTDGQGQAKSVN